MQFLKRHFEKIILSAVLVGLGAAAFWLALAVTEAKNQLTTETSRPPASKPWVAVDLTALRSALKIMTEVPEFVLTGEHNLFNPVTWKMAPDGRLFKMTLSGPDALTVTDIRPLYFTVALDSQAGTGFYMTAKHALGKALPWFANLNEKATPQRPYPILGILGTNAASEITIQVSIPETGEKVPVSIKEPYRRLEGYEVDMNYNASDTTNKFTKKHLEDTLPLSGEMYNIIAITNNVVTVQDTRTLQKTDKPWSGGSKP